MAKIFQFTVAYSIYGQSAADQFKMTGLIRFDGTYLDERFDAMGAAIGEALRKRLVNKAKVLQVHFRENVKKGAAPIPAGHYARIKVSKPGLRVSATNANVSLTEIVAIFAKDARGGKGGNQQIRGALFANEFDSAPDGSLVTKAPFDVALFESFGAELKAAIENNGGELVMKAPKGSDFVTGARAVPAIVFAGIGLRQEGNTHKSAAEKMEDAIEAEINEVERKINRARKNDDGTLSPLAGAILNGFIQLVKEIVDRYGLAVILRYTLPAQFRVVLNQLPQG